MDTYLITQATGQQSQWVITHLIAAGVKIHAVVRDAQNVSPVLRHSSVNIFQGETIDFDIIHQAAQGCKGVFLNTFPIPGLEAQQAKTVIKACQRAGVERVVSSTTFAAGNKAFWDDSTTTELGLHWYFEAKAGVENAVRKSGFKSYTILRPVWMIHDYLLPSAPYNYPELSTTGELAHAYSDGAKMIHTDSFDVGRYAASHPERFGGQEIELGNEALTVEEVRDLLIKVSGRQVSVRKRTTEEVVELQRGQVPMLSLALQLLASVKNISAGSEGAKAVQEKFGIPFTSFEMAMQRDKARLLECLPA